MKTLSYKVKTFRDAGLEAKWTRTTAGAPIIMARLPGIADRGWYMVSKRIWADMQVEGLREAFERHTMLGAFFSVPA